MRGEARTGQSVVLERQRENIEDLLGDDIGGLQKEPDVTDIICNPPLPGEDFCRIWVSRIGRDREPVARMSPERAIRLIGSVAASMGKEATEETPSVEGFLITNGARFQGLVYPSVNGGFFAIRKHASAVFPYSQYVDERKMTSRQVDVIERAIGDRLNIIIAGGTGSGKTTLLNATILSMTTISPHHRFFIIEDNPELKCSAPDRTMTATSHSMSIRDLVKAAMRSFADRIIVGETRGPEMLDILDVWNTGHEGGAATIHSNTAHPKYALKRIEHLLLKANLRYMQPVIAETVNLVICIESSRGHRRVNQVASVQGWDGHDYQITQEA
jgi:P-type conjugative transfer ATPase TrbB